MLASGWSGGGGGHLGTLSDQKPHRSQFKILGCRGFENVEQEAIWFYFLLLGLIIPDKNCSYLLGVSKVSSHWTRKPGFWWSALTACPCAGFPRFCLNNHLARAGHGAPWAVRLSAELLVRPRWSLTFTLSLAFSACSFPEHPQGARHALSR